MRAAFLWMAAAIAAVGMTGVADADTVLPVNQNHVVVAGGGGTSWDFKYDGTGASNLAIGWQVFDASVNAGGVLLGDAFDGGLVVSANGHYVVPPGTMERTVNADGTFLDESAVTVAGLNITKQFFVMASSPTVRTLIRVSNPGVTPISADVTWESNLGSDNSTRVKGTSGGDTTFTAADNWIVTDDQTSDTSASGDPAVTHVIQMADNVNVPTSVSLSSTFAYPTAFSFDGVRAVYHMDLAPNDTRYMVLFSQLHTTTQDALADAALFNGTLPGAYLAGLSEMQIRGFEPGAQPIPLPSAVWAGLGLLGVLAVRRARRLRLQ